MVAGNGDEGHAPLGQGLHSPVKEPDGCRRGHGTVVNVPGQNHPGGLFPVHQGQQGVFDKVFLIRQKGAAIEHPPQVPVRGMDEFQRDSSFSVCRLLYSRGETPKRFLNIREKLKMSGYPVDRAASPGEYPCSVMSWQARSIR